MSPTKDSPLTSSKNSHYQNEAKGKAFFYEIEFYLRENTSYFHINSLAFSLALKQRLGAAWKWLTVDLVNCDCTKRLTLPTLEDSPSGAIKKLSLHETIDVCKLFVSARQRRWNR